MSKAVKGQYGDGQSSKSRPARLVLHPSGRLEIFDEADDRLIFAADVRAVAISSRLGNTPRTLTLPDGARFVTDDNDTLDAWLSATGQGGGLLHALESHLGIVAGAGILTVLLIGLFFWKGLPMTANAIAEALPAETTRSMGEGTLDILDQFFLEPTELTDAEQADILAVFEPWLENHAALDANVRFRAGMGPNALALPDGTIVFTDALVDLAAEDEELVAVLLHELGHLHHRHLLRRVLQDSILTVVVVLITGDIEVADLLLGVPTLIVDLSWSREFELEADRFALTGLVAGGVSLDHFASIMQRMADFYAEEEQRAAAADDDSSSAESEEIALPEVSDEDGVTIDPQGGTEADGGPGLIGSFLSTHPATEDRIRLVEEYRERQ